MALGVFIAHQVVKGAGKVAVGHLGGVEESGGMGLGAVVILLGPREEKAAVIDRHVHRGVWVGPLDDARTARRHDKHAVMPGSF